MLRQLFATPLSWFYGLGVAFRHKLFDWGILRSEEFDIPVVCVGNLTVGGTGKTPHTEMLVRMFSPAYKVAVLSRGYRRRSKGFVLATSAASCKKVGDEPRQIKLKFPDIPVAVCEKRAEGIHRLRTLHPEVNLIILDDAFQHRYVESWVNIVLEDYSRPIYRDRLLPAGSLRDVRSQMYRANFIVVTKCPEDLKPIDVRVASKCLEPYPYQSIFFTRMVSLPPVPLFPEYGRKEPRPGQDVVAMAGIGNPDEFVTGLARKYRVVDTLIYPDHYNYKTRDLPAMRAALAKGGEDTVILTTEKDAVKMSNSRKIPDELRERLYYVPIRVDFVDTVDRNTEADFLQKLEPYVRSNHKYKTYCTE